MSNATFNATSNNINVQSYKIKFVIVTVITLHNAKLTAIPTPAIRMAQSTFREVGPFELEVLQVEIQVEGEPYIEPTNTSHRWTLPTACLCPAPLT